MQPGQHHEIKLLTVFLWENYKKANNVCLMFPMFSMSEKLCLQWNDFKENIISSLGNLREDQEFTDVTLACEDGRRIEAHKIILAGSSPFFDNLLKRNKHSHPLVYMKGMNGGHC